MGRLCGLACSNSHLDLCHVRQLPGNPVGDASQLHPMMWRFLPTLDPQVSLFLSRDLDSRISAREVAAVTEWLQVKIFLPTKKNISSLKIFQSGQPLHSMKDHPAHKVSLLGGLWGARMTQVESSNAQISETM